MKWISISTERALTAGDKGARSLRSLSSSHFTTFLVIPVLCVSMLLIFSGCSDSNDSDNLSTGSFSAEVSGAVTQSFSGISVLQFSKLVRQSGISLCFRITRPEADPCLP